MRIRQWMVGMMVCGAGLTGLGQTAAPPPHAPRADGERPMLQWLASDPGIGKELGLTTNQTETIKRLRFDTQKQMIDLRARLEHAAEAQAELISQDSPNEAALMKAVEEAGTARTDIAKLEVRRLLAVHNVLTPEQRAKLRERFSEWRKTHQAKRMDRPRLPRQEQQGPGQEPPPPPEQPEE
jgi:Spy/CpxP family protein refolding chaperone